MERKSSPLIKKYGKVDFYYDDLKAIYNCFNSKTDDTELETDKYIYKSFDEFIENNKGVSDLTIKSANLRIYLTVNKDYCKLEGSNFTIKILMKQQNHFIT